jgi:hypothetical protein
MHQKQGKLYQRRLENYYSLSAAKAYVSFHEFIGTYPPSGAMIRFLYEQAERSNDTSTGISNFDRYTREIQGIGEEGGALGLDWTFAVCKNFNVVGAKAMFTMQNSNAEIVNLALVPSTKAEEVAHLNEQAVRRRKNLRPKYIFTDMRPHNNSFWKMIFGPIKGKLEMFHCMGCILEHVNHRCEWYWKCLVDLQKAIYKYNSSDETGLLRALKDGTMSSNGKKHKSSEIQSLRESKRWKQRYSTKYLCNEHHTWEQIQQCLDGWYNSWKDKTDIMNNRPLIPNREKAVAAIEEQNAPFPCPFHQRCQPNCVPQNPRHPRVHS